MNDSLHGNEKMPEVGWRIRLHHDISDPLGHWGTVVGVKPCGDNTLYEVQSTVYLRASVVQMMVIRPPVPAQVVTVTTEMLALPVRDTMKAAA